MGSHPPPASFCRDPGRLLSTALGRTLCRFCLSDRYPWSTRWEHWTGSLCELGGLVFANETGGIVNPSNLRNRSFKRVLELAGLPAGTRFHDPQRACATLLLSRNVNPKVVSEMLGYANIAITLDTYSYILPNVQEKAARAPKVALR